jgi:hypothetical protein
MTCLPNPAYRALGMQHGHLREMCEAISIMDRSFHLPSISSGEQATLRIVLQSVQAGRAFTVIGVNVVLQNLSPSNRIYHNKREIGTIDVPVTRGWQ